MQSAFKRKISSFRVAAGIWLRTNAVASLWIFGLGIYFREFFVFLMGVGISFLLSFPVVFILFFVLPWIARSYGPFNTRLLQLTGICMLCCLPFSILIVGLLYPAFDSGLKGFPFIEWLLITGALLSCVAAAIWWSTRDLKKYFPADTASFKINQQTNMEPTHLPENPVSENPSGRSNKIMIKGIITGVLILVMMIPTVFINNLVYERQIRQSSVAKEVSSRWAGTQTIAGPFISLPYKVSHKDEKNVVTESLYELNIIPDNLHVSGKIDQELRERSIYKVLLYRTSLSEKGELIVQLPKEVNASQVQWADAKICFGISDFKGIEERIVIHFNGADQELSPGLPSLEIQEKGLSAPITLSPENLGKPLAFSMDLKIKGSEKLHFIPLAGNSDFTLQSSWPNPSFDGNNLPTQRSVTDHGFTASWVFNKANLPFGTVLQDFKLDPSILDFGVTIVEPADQYAKTDRSIKYAILVIGLTFSLFFIVELLQKKPIHPVQYVLIGLALVIFYTLLLSISEFLPFDFAYGIAAFSVIALIGLYAKSHFHRWSSAGIFSGILFLLYGFIFILIRLEDTALLVGSIGLFIILAITMYASKKVNWYGKADDTVLAI